MASSGKNGGTFGSGKDSENRSAREAYRTAKDRNGIPRCQSPIGHATKIEDKNNKNKYVTIYEHKNVKGENILIRKDNPVNYASGPSQGPHYNARPSEEKLKQHPYHP